MVHVSLNRSDILDVGDAIGYTPAQKSSAARRRERLRVQSHPLIRSPQAAVLYDADRTVPAVGGLHELK